MMYVVGNRLWPATIELAFILCHIFRPNTAGITQRGNLLGNCLMTVIASSVKVRINVADSED